MRYYDLELTSPDTGAVLTRSDGSPFKLTSYPNGKYDPTALNVIFDIPVGVADLPLHQPAIIIEGVSLEDLTNAQQYAAGVKAGQREGGANLTLKGGMGAGLPLNNPAQIGRLTDGAVFLSWGNWISTDMALSFVVIPTIYHHAAPGNFVFNWQKGQDLSDALQQTLSTIFPNVAIKFQLGETYVAPRTDIHFCASFAQLSTHIYQLTGAVRMRYQAGEILIFDGGAASETVHLAFADFVGQPTWIDRNVVQAKLVMRGDITVGRKIKFPAQYEGLPGFEQIQQAAYPNFYKYKSAIQGEFFVSQMRHIGNFRDPDGDAWVTIVNAIPLQ